MGHEPVVRLIAFAAVLAGMALWEAVAPRRRQAVPRLLRWSSNLGIVVLNTLVLRLAFPVLAVGAALWAESAGFGLLHWLAVPYALALPLAVLLLDAAIYGQHVLFHKVPLLWRLHRMHHADLETDVSTGLRFHPFEILLSMGIKMIVVVVLGAPAAAVILFEVLLNATSMFNHGNVRLSTSLDRGLRWLIVTPDMHRVHHSIHRDETDSNYGFNLSIWDRLFGSYRAQPRDGHEAMIIGIERFRDPRDLQLPRMLLQPFRREQAAAQTDGAGGRP